MAPPDDGLFAATNAIPNQISADLAREATGGKTDWMSMTIGEVIDILGTMQAGRASGDAETILAAIEAVRRASERMAAAFGDDNMVGQGAQAALDAGRSLAADMAATLTEATKVGDALERSVGVLGAARGQEGRLRELQQEVRENPETAPSVRYEVERLMTDSYSTPMREVHATLPVEHHWASRILQDDVGAVTGGGSGGSGSGAESGRGQAANTVDAGDLARAGGTPVPPPAAGPAAPPNPARPAPVTPFSASDSTPGASVRRAADDPDGLLRGGRGTADSDAAETRSVQGAGGSGSGTAADGDGTGAGRSGEGPPVVPLAPAAPNIAAGTGAAPGTAGTAPGGGPRMTPLTTTPTGPAGAPPASRRPADEDDRHKAAPYLNNRENGTELVGDLPLVGPPVIGDWVPGATAPTPPAPAPESPAGTDPSVGHTPSGSADADAATAPAGEAHEELEPRRPSAT